MQTRLQYLLTLPFVLLTVLLLGGPLIYLAFESFRTFVPGRLSSDPVFTWANYSALLEPSYRLFILDTLRISIIAAIVSTIIGFLLAHYIIREAGTVARVLVLSVVVAMLFIGIARVFSLSIAFGPYGIIRFLRMFTHVRGNEYSVLQAGVIAGIVHYTAPIATLTMISYLASIDRRLCDAAQTLGASRLKAFFSITIPLALPGLTATLLTSFALALSAFTVPLILGRGLVPTVTILIYQRFSEVPNYPSGAALAIGLFVISIVLTGLSIVAARALQNKLNGRSV